MLFTLIEPLMAVRNGCAYLWIIIIEVGVEEWWRQ
jgi:hypothetical protein